MSRTATTLTFLSDADTPVSLYHKLRDPNGMGFLFESTDGDSRLARFSFLGVSPRLSMAFYPEQAVRTNHLTGEVQTLPITNPMAMLAEEIEAFCRENDIGTATDSQGNAFPFQGGWVGYMGYGATRYFDNIPQQTPDPYGVPFGYYGLYDTVILYDHLFRRMVFLSHRPKPEAMALWETYRARLNMASPLSPLKTQAMMSDPAVEDSLFQETRGPFSAQQFCERVQEAQALIQKGEIFQIVLSHRFSLDTQADTLDIYRILQALNPSPYGYLLNYPGYSYLGASPETFVTCQNGTVTLRALAGTRHRGQSEEDDQKLAHALRNNEKECAEHHMLVDLGRNDLGRVCEPGTITVGEVGQVTRYTHVMHMATELSGTLRADKTAYNVFQSCFPRGTVSGAPKIRAMQILSRLEPEQRGIYSGVVGYFDFYGNMDGAIAIRSALVKDGVAHVNAGAGVVYDSEPMAEYEETRNKAKSTLKAIAIANKLLALEDLHPAGAHP